jgi:hypothetical protein
MAFHGSNEGEGRRRRKPTADETAPRGPLHQWIDSIALNNPAVMREHAFYHEYNKLIPVRVMDVMDMFVHSENKDRRHPTAGMFAERVCDTLEVSLPPALEAMEEAVNLGMLSFF